MLPDKPAFSTYRTAPQYKGIRTQALYIPMRDGVKIAVDLHLPGNLQPGDKIPALTIATRYWRALDIQRGFGWLVKSLKAPMQFLTEHGYAVVQVDVRGTGASFGTRRYEWDIEEVCDGGDIAEWIIQQPWSNGRVGAVGTSYSGTTAELMAVPGHPAVKAVLPRFNEFDPYTDIAFPGGVYLQGFIEAWHEMTRAMDDNLVNKRFGALSILIKGVKPVDNDQGRKLLRQAVAQHQANIHAATNVQGVVYRDDIPPSGYGVKAMSVYAHQKAIEKSGTVIYGWGGWFDGATADAVIRRFLTFSNPQTAVIGAWNHGANQHASPYARGPENIADHWIEYLRFFDHYLKDTDTGVQQDVQQRVLTYFTCGEERWKTTTEWPPKGVTPQRWYLAAHQGLSQTKPNTQRGDDKYTIDFEATTGPTNRWYTQMGGGPVIYPDRAEADRRLLTYTSAPLSAALEITGYPVVTLYITSTATDGAFFVYLEEVDERGRVTYLTEGLLRALHRKISAEKPPYKQATPYHSFLRRNGAPLVPGEVTALTFHLQPISVLVPKGRRLRVAIAGSDKDLFPRIPASETPTITVARNRHYASFIDLPVMPRS